MQIVCPGTNLGISNVYKNAMFEPTMQFTEDAKMHLIEFRYGGWILMSNDINATPVLAYSKTGTWESDTSIMPPALVELLCDYMEQISEIKSSKQNSDSEAELFQQNIEKWKGLQSMASQYVYYLTQSKANNVAALLVDENGYRFQWGQLGYSYKKDSPKYNKFAPKGCTSNILYGDNQTNHMPVGCASVAMGQIMKYWKFPPQYDWDKMPAFLSSNTPVQEENNIAHLIKNCADNAEVNFLCTGSWTTTNKVESGMQQMHFPESNKRRRGDTDDGEWWPNLIKRQLNNGWPVIYRGDKCDICFSKHFWVIDGYNQENLFHCNWGWNGSYNGYYNLYDWKNPYGDKPGDYRKNNMIVRNIHPDWSNTNDWSGNNITKGNDEELRVFCTNARMSNINLKGNSQSKIAFTGELIIDGPFMVSEGATLTLACYDKELAHQRASTNSIKMAVEDHDGNDDFGKNRNINYDVSFKEEKGENLKYSFVVHPNPTRQKISISMSPHANDLLVKDVYVYDSKGKLCYQSQFKGNHVTRMLPSLPQGVYVVRVISDNDSFTQKLIIQ